MIDLIAISKTSQVVGLSDIDNCLFSLHSGGVFVIMVKLCLITAENPPFKGRSRESRVYKLIKLGVLYPDVDLKILIITIIKIFWMKISPSHGSGSLGERLIAQGYIVCTPRRTRQANGINVIGIGLKSPHQ